MADLVDNLQEISDSVQDIKAALEDKGIEMTGVPFSAYAAAVASLGTTNVTVTGNTIAQLDGDTFTGVWDNAADINRILQSGSTNSTQALYRDGTWKDATITGSTVILGGTYKFIPYVSGREIHYSATQYITVPGITVSSADETLVIT